MNLGWILSIGTSMLIFLCWGWRSLRTFCVLNMHHSKSVSALNGSFWTQKKSGVQISSRKWNPFVTDEFSSETLILRKRLSILFTKCIHLLRGPSQLFSTCYVGEIMIPCQLSTFSEIICTASQFSWSFSSKIWVNARKRPSVVRNGWKLLTWLWMVHFEHTKSLESK